jgi:hypothetical protein
MLETFHKSDEANRVQDLLRALAFLRSQTQQRIELRGLNKAGVWCLAHHLRAFAARNKYHQATKTRRNT